MGEAPDQRRFLFGFAVAVVLLAVGAIVSAPVRAVFTLYVTPLQAFLTHPLVLVAGAPALALAVVLLYDGGDDG